jgi:hypothetical protein
MEATAGSREVLVNVSDEGKDADGTTGADGADFGCEAPIV